MVAVYCGGDILATVAIVMQNGIWRGMGEDSFSLHRGANKSLVRPGRKQATATEGFDVHISFL